MSQLGRLMAHLQARPDVTVNTNGWILQAVMRGGRTIYIGWNTKARTFAWHSGGLRAGEGELLMPDPALATEQVVMMLEAPARPTPRLKVRGCGV